MQIWGIRCKADMLASKWVYDYCVWGTRNDEKEFSQTDLPHCNYCWYCVVHLVFSGFKINILKRKKERNVNWCKHKKEKKQKNTEKKVISTHVKNIIHNLYYTKTIY